MSKIYYDSTRRVHKNENKEPINSTLKEKNNNNMNQQHTAIKEIYILLKKNV